MSGVRLSASVCAKRGRVAVATSRTSGGARAGVCARRWGRRWWMEREEGQGRLWCGLDERRRRFARRRSGAKQHVAVRRRLLGSAYSSLFPPAMLPLHRHGPCLLLSALSLLASSVVNAFEVPVSDTDYDRQICSGMWGGKNTFINGTPSPEPSCYACACSTLCSYIFR